MPAFRAHPPSLETSEGGPEQTISPPAAVTGTVSFGWDIYAHLVPPNLLLSSVTLAWYHSSLGKVTAEGSWDLLVVPPGKMWSLVPGPHPKFLQVLRMPSVRTRYASIL